MCQVRATERLQLPRGWSRAWTIPRANALLFPQSCRVVAAGVRLVTRRAGTYHCGSTLASNT